MVIQPTTRRSVSICTKVVGLGENTKFFEISENLTLSGNGQSSTSCITADKRAMLYFVFPVARADWTIKQLKHHDGGSLYVDKVTLRVYD